MVTRFFFLITLFFGSSIGWSQNIKGLYVDGFASILGNQNKEDSLLRFAENNGFNYLTLYQMHIVNANTPLTNVSSAQTFADFISKAKTQYSITQIGVASENFNAFNTVYHVYNQQHSNPNEKIDVYNLEFEFWVSSSVEPGGVYCDDYLQPNGIACDTSGAFDFFVSTLHQIDSLAGLDGATSEVYLGWFTDGQGAEIVQTGVDRVLLSAYIPSAAYDQSYLEGYTSTRLVRLASAEIPIKVLPLMSAEPAFMHDWAVSNPFFLPLTHFENNLIAETDPWKNYIMAEGVQWFAYSDMPLKNMDLSLSSEQLNAITVYPNPAKTEVFVESGEIPETMELFTVDGDLVNTTYSASRLDLSNVSPGFYFLKMNFNEITVTKKLTVN